MLRLRYNLTLTKSAHLSSPLGGTGKLQHTFSETSSSIASMDRMDIQILKTNSSYSDKSLFNLPFSELSADWYGNKIAFEFSYCLALFEQELCLACKCNGNPISKPGASYGSFVAGLWEYSVCELFIGHTGLDSYREFNLAPNGAWWAADLSSYREQTSDSLESLQLKTFSETDSKGSWKCALRIPVQAKDLDNLTCNVTAIIGHDDQVFLAANSDSSVAPDFHLSSIRTNPIFLDFD